MIRLSRFERKVLWLMVAVTCAPLIAALILGQVALRENYQLGLNERVLGSLQRYLAVYQEHLELLRDQAEQEADAVANHWRVRAALEQGDAKRIATVLEQVIANRASIVAVAVQMPKGQDKVVVNKASTKPSHTTKVFVRELDNDRAMVVTVNVPQWMFKEYTEAGQFVRDFEVLVRGTSYISNRYLAVYAMLVLAVIAAALGLGIWGARQVTRRVALLALATQQVGAGDWTVQVPLSGNDEITALTQAFNTMVRDMRESRDRIAYLQRISAWQDVARRLAHEIKNPLTPILLAVQELDTGFDTVKDPTYAHKLKEARSIVEEEVATLKRLVEEFRTFAKLPSVQPELMDLRSFVQQATRTLWLGKEREADQAADIQIDIELGQDAIPVKLDAMLLKGCLDNLILNARQAIEAQKAPAKKGHIRISTRRTATKGIIEVEDDGPGVSIEYQERVFDPYHTSKPTGTGLGLAIVKKVVLEHGGDVYCTRSTLGGASFVIHLPLDLSARVLS